MLPSVVNNGNRDVIRAERALKEATRVVQNEVPQAYSSSGSMSFPMPGYKQDASKQPKEDGCCTKVDAKMSKLIEVTSAIHSTIKEMFTFQRSQAENQAIAMKMMAIDKKDAEAVDPKETPEKKKKLGLFGFFSILDTMLVAGVMPLINGAINFLKSNWEKVGKSFGDTTKFIQDGWNNFATKFVDSIKGAVDWLLHPEKWFGKTATAHHAAKAHSQGHAAPPKTATAHHAAKAHSQIGRAHV